MSEHKAEYVTKKQLANDQHYALPKLCSVITYCIAVAMDLIEYISISLYFKSGKAQHKSTLLI